ncbi:MAG: hypothetical protein Q4B42_06890, partial [Oscillospiraceae bacterium]|nr:hypothetical protein [Oscillospiraceae bacterium]
MMEQVLVVSRDRIHDYISGRNGLIRENSKEIFDIIASGYEFMPRPLAEENPAYKQIIPYVILRRGEQIFATRRLNKGGEKRLHGLVSIGVGGHINPVDGEGGNLLMRGLWREIHEEVCIEHCGDLAPCGFINDDSNSVGSVHLGACFTLDVEGDVSVAETEKLEGLWMTLPELRECFDKMETWTQ